MTPLKAPEREDKSVSDPGGRPVARCGLGRVGTWACVSVLLAGGCQSVWHHHTKPTAKEQQRQELMAQRRTDVAVQMARIKLGQGDLVAAEAHAQRVLEADPQRAEAHLILGQIAAARSRLDKAQECLKRAVQLDPNLAEAYACLGLLHQRNGEREQSLQAFDRAVRVDPDHPSYRLGLAASHAAMNQRDQAEAVLTEAVERFEKEPELHEALGELYAMKQQYPQAMTHFRVAVALEKDNLLARRSKAYVHYWMGQYSEALKGFKELVAEDHYDPGSDVLATMADCEMKLGRPAEAVRHYEQACRAAPRDGNLHLMRGHCYLRLHNAQAAGEAYRKAIDHVPAQAEGYYALGFALFRQGKVRESLVEYERAAKRDRSDPVVHFLMGCAYRKLGSDDQARRAFLRALELDPRYDLARAYLQRPGSRRGQLR